MSRYRRSLLGGGTFFFTVVLADRHSALLVEQIERLRAVYRRVQGDYPFETVAICVFPTIYMRSGVCLLMMPIFLCVGV